MLSKLKKQNKGFTIIEVLIVLAIAGLIMVIVFLAVPALQRNSRNTGYRQDATSIVSAYGEVSANKGGAVLAAGVNTTAGSDAANVLSAANVKQITFLRIAVHAAGTITANATAAAGGFTATEVNTTRGLIRTGAKCAAQDDGTATAGTSRQIAMYYAVETAGGLQIQCIES